MREAQKARGEKPRYDGRWRPAPGKVLPAPPEGGAPVIRFANPEAGEVHWDDVVKGEIRVSNREIDDLILVRADGVPTYNFAVVVDDIDMAITHVFRGDEHINNTPWQINLYRALEAPLPRFGHHPVILGDDGQKLSKRRGAVSVTAYRDAGYLPEAMLNYLARLGWSHGDDELFTLPQVVAWFDGSHLARSPAQWDAAKLAWVNAHHLKAAADERLAELVSPFLAARGVAVEAVPVGLLVRRIALLKDRCTTLVDLAGWLAMFEAPVAPDAAEAAAHPAAPHAAALATLAAQLRAAEAWEAPAINAAVKATLATHGLKMGQFAPVVRLVVCGRAQTPSLDAVLALFARDTVLARLAAAVAAAPA
jgi:glutamyl-tRNA synthetase